MGELLKFIKNQKGVGLPEVSMGIAILSILLGAIVGALNSSYDVFNFHEKSIYEQTQRTIILGRIEQNIKNGKAIYSPLQRDVGKGPTTSLDIMVIDATQPGGVQRKTLMVVNKSLVQVNFGSTTQTVLSEACIEKLTFLRDSHDARVVYVNIELKEPNSKSKNTNTLKEQKVMFADNVEALVGG